MVLSNHVAHYDLRPVFHYQSNTAGVISGAKLPTLAEHLSSPRFQQNLCCSILSLLCGVLWMIVVLFVFFSFGHSSVFYLLRFTSSDYSLWYLEILLKHLQIIYIFVLSFLRFTPFDYSCQYRQTFRLNKLFIKQIYIFSDIRTSCTLVINRWL